MACNDDDASRSPISKRLKTSGDDDDPELLCQENQSSLTGCPSKSTDDTFDRHPHTFVTWNCNGFTSRTRWNSKELEQLLQETNNPDMLCLQEVRLKASGPDHQRLKPMDSEYRGSVELAMTTIFQDYTPFWSLADHKYAGTLTLIHKRCMQDPQMKLSSMSLEQSDFSAFTPQSAIALILRRFQTNRSACGLPEVVATTTATVKSPDNNHKKKATTQMSMTSFFAPKTTTTPNGRNNASFSLSRKVLPCHDPEGRFQFFFFPDMDVMQTYVPNNGTKEESFRKRRQWDDEMMVFLKERKQVLKSCHHGTTSRKLLWLGDMNVAREYIDGTHWQRQRDGSIYEWWLDETKCFAQGDHKKKNLTSDKGPENVGIPGFTIAERTRFAKLLREGDFGDVWRELHPHGVKEATSQERSKWDRANYTWRGHLSRNGGGLAKYQGKGQRLDYFLLSPSRYVTGDGVDNGIVMSCDILGYGEQKLGLFCGSDHCAVRLELIPLTKRSNHLVL
jgi:exonuclease III